MLNNVPAPWTFALSLFDGCVLLPLCLHMLDGETHWSTFHSCCSLPHVLLSSRLSSLVCLMNIVPLVGQMLHVFPEVPSVPALVCQPAAMCMQYRPYREPLLLTGPLYNKPAQRHFVWPIGGALCTDMLSCLCFFCWLFGCFSCCQSVARSLACFSYWFCCLLVPCHQWTILSLVLAPSSVQC